MRVASAPAQGTPAAASGVSPTKMSGRGLWGRLRGIVSGEELLTLINQAVVSAASFLTTIIIARFTTPSELGLYSIGLSVLASCLCIQEALISTPYAVQRHHSTGTIAERAGTSLAQTGLLSALVAVILGVTAFGSTAIGGGAEWAAVFCALAAVAPFLILREFGRRFAFAHLRMAQPLMIDAAAAAVQLAALVWLGWMGLMSAVTAYVALGVASGLTGFAWLYRGRTNFTLRAVRIQAETKQSWDLGKWLFANQLVLALQASLVYALVAWLAGTTATGIYAACMSIALFSNPLILGASNLLTPKSASAWMEGGGKRLRHESIRDARRLGAVLVLFCAAVVLAGDAAMRFLYPSADYAGQGYTIIVLAVGILVMGVGMPATSALTSMGHTRVIFWVALWAAMITVILVWWLVPNWGLIGAAYGVLAGNVVRSAARWVVLLSLVPRRAREAGPQGMGSDSIPAAVFAVLRQLTDGCNADDWGDWVIEQLDRGLEADIYAVRRADHRPVCQSCRYVAIKLFKPRAAPKIHLLRRRVASLARLHTALNGSSSDGWKIHVPAPLYSSESPAALVMSIVPGRTVSCWLEVGELPREVFHSLPQAIIAVVNRLWSIGRLHGDLTLDNILCDIGARDLSFVDPGMRSICPFRDDPTGRWEAPAHDLAHLLHDLGASVLSAMLNPVAFRRKQRFAEALVRAYLETIGSPAERQSHLNEIQACTRLHLMALGRGSYSLRGLYQKLQRQIGFRRIEKILSAVEAEAELSPSQAVGSELQRSELPSSRAGSGIEEAMPSTKGLDQMEPSVLAGGDGQRGGTGGILSRIFETLDRAGIPYCVLHGYETYPQQVTSDVDCVISAGVPPHQLAVLFHENRARIGAELVCCKGSSFVFAGRNADRSPCFLTLDLSADYELNGLKFYSGREVVESRRRRDQFWIPAPHIEFGGYLVRRIGKAQLNDGQAERLSALYRQDPAGCQQQIGRFWNAGSGALIAHAAHSGEWGEVRRRLPALGDEIRLRAMRWHPWYAIGNWSCRIARRVRAVGWPEGGLAVAFLGPDGAGKSSVIKAVPQALAGAFNRTTCYGFAPGILRWLRPADGPKTRPHAAPPRSPVISIMRALGYWLVYYLLCYRVTLRLHLAHSTLVLHDRHLLDALVDPKRYRYSGPRWLLRLIWWFVPKPDLVVLLDAPPEVLQSRKQEVGPAVGAGHRRCYRPHFATSHDARRASPWTRRDGVRRTQSGAFERRASGFPCRCGGLR